MSRHQEEENSCAVQSFVGRSKRLAAYKFLARHLGLSHDKVAKADGSVDESDVVIEKTEDLHVFTAKHPRPAHAVKTPEAVEALLWPKKPATPTDKR